MKRGKIMSLYTIHRIEVVGGGRRKEKTTTTPEHACESFSLLGKACFDVPMKGIGGNEKLHSAGPSAFYCGVCRRLGDTLTDGVSRRVTLNRRHEAMQWSAAPRKVYPAYVVHIRHFSRAQLQVLENPKATRLRWWKHVHAASRD
jgi:hypothetical protein